MDGVWVVYSEYYEFRIDAIYTDEDKAFAGIKEFDGDGVAFVRFGESISDEIRAHQKREYYASGER